MVGALEIATAWLGDCRAVTVAPGTTQLVDARFGRLPVHVWGALFVVWLWPALLLADFWESWLLWPLLGTGPTGMLIVLVELVLRARRRRSPA